MNDGLGSFFLSIGVDIQDLEQGLRNARYKIDGFGAKIKDLSEQLSLKLSTKNIENFSKSIEKSGEKLSLLVSAPLALVAKSALNASGNFESLRIAFDTMLGSAEKGKQLMEDIQKFNLSTPFELDQVAQASKGLLAFGFAQEQIIPNLRMIGDLSSALGININELAQIYGKAKVQGRLFAQDINQLTGRGIPVIQEFAKQFGVAENQINKMTEDGEISFANLEQAFISLTSEGGKFFGMTANQSTTWKGVMSNASDSITESLVVLGDTIIKSLNLKKVIPEATEYLSELVDAFKNLSSTSQTTITILGGLAIVIPPLMIIAGKALPMMASGFTALISPVGLVTVAIGALVAVLGEHYLTTKKIESAVNSMNEVNQEVSNSIRTEVDEITKLNDILQSNTTSYEEKKQALEKLQQINPQYFGGLNAENLNYSELNRSLSLYIDNLRNAQEAKQLSDKLSSNQSLVAELKKDPSKGLSFAQGVGIALVSPKGQQQFKNNVKNIVDEQIRTIEQENLRMKHQLTNLKIKGYGVSDMTTTAGSTTASTIAKAGVGGGKANKDLQKQLEEESKLYEGLVNDIQKMYINSMTDTNRREIELLKYNSNEELKEYEKRIKGREDFENLFAHYRLNKEKDLQERIFEIEQEKRFSPDKIKGTGFFKGFDLTAVQKSLQLTKNSVNDLKSFDVSKGFDLGAVSKNMQKHLADMIGGAEKLKLGLNIPQSVDKRMENRLNNMLQLGVNAQIAGNNVANLEKYLGLAQGTIDKTNYQAFADQASVVLESTNIMRDVLTNFAIDATATTSIMIGELIAGTKTLQDIGQTIKLLIADMLKSLAFSGIAQGIQNLVKGNPLGGLQIFGGIGAGIFSGILKGKAQNQQQSTNQQQQYSVIRGGDIFTAQNRYQLIKGF